MSWVGGSSKRIDPGGISTPALMISSTEPRPEMYVFQSSMALSTSSQRLRAKNSYFSFQYSGTSSRICFHNGYGSASMSKS